MEGTESHQKKQVNEKGKKASKRIIPVTERTLNTELDPHVYRFRRVDFGEFVSNGEEAKRTSTVKKGKKKKEEK